MTAGGHPGFLSVERLAKVAGLLASDHDGERSAAAYRATLILRESGWTWRELVERAAAPPCSCSGAADEIDDEDLVVPWPSAVRACLDERWRLSPWETAFVDSIRHRRKISPKQRQALARIYAKVTGEAL